MVSLLANFRARRAVIFETDTSREIEPLIIPLVISLWMRQRRNREEIRSVVHRVMSLARFFVASDFTEEQPTQTLPPPCLVAPLKSVDEGHRGECTLG